MIQFKCTDAATTKRAQSAAMAMREIDDSIAYTTRAGGSWLNEESIVHAFGRTVRVKSVYHTGEQGIMIDILDGSDEHFGMRPLDGSSFVLVTVTQHQPIKEQQQL